MTETTRITHRSHLDHGLTMAHLRFLLDQIPTVNGLTVKTLELPEELPSLPCGLHGPVMGDEPVPEDEVRYETRNDRPNESRICDRGTRLVRLLTVVIGPDGMLFTAYGGPPAEREPGDPSLQEDPDALNAAKGYWKLHALAAGS
jgi:hypothetical protein